MADKPKKSPKFTSPKGIAIFPWLNKPDTKFVPEGQYKITLRMSEEAAQPMIDKLQPMFDAVVAKAQKDPKRKGKKIQTHDFYKRVFDDEGNETGEIDFNFKMKASGVKKDGSPWTMKPDLFDATGAKLDPNVRIFGGSKVRVAYTVGEYDKAIGTGISLRLEGVQVIKLVEGSRDASSYGFGDESDDEDADSDTDQSTEDSDGEGEGEESEDDF